MFFFFFKLIYTYLLCVHMYIYIYVLIYIFIMCTYVYIYIQLLVKYTPEMLVVLFLDVFCQLYIPQPFSPLLTNMAGLFMAKSKHDSMMALKITYPILSGGLSHWAYPMGCNSFSAKLMWSCSPNGAENLRLSFVPRAVKQSFFPYFDYFSDVYHLVI